MMYIERHWETIDDLRDISRVIREYYNRDLADEMDKLIDIQEDEIETLKSLGVKSLKIEGRLKTEYYLEGALTIDGTDFSAEQIEETYRTIGKNVRKYRLENNISQEKLSEILDTNSKFIGHVERFERFISLKKIIELAEYFNIPVKSFFE